MRADRLLSLLLLLQTRGRMTAGALAERLEVTERTIYRDLDALSAAGVPVYAERGRNGGCVLQPGYRTELTGLNQSEVASLFAGAAGQVLDGLGFGPALQTALVKLEASLPTARRADAERVRGRIYVDAAAWFSSHERAPYLPTLRDAVFADRRLELTYDRAGGIPSVRIVEPLGLVVKGGIWYLIAMANGAFRVFRVSRVRDAKIVNDTFERPRRFDLAAFWARWSKDFVAGIPQYHVKMRVRREAIGILPQVLGERIRPAIEAARRQRTQRLTLAATFDSLEAACGHLLGLGTLVEAIAPEELRLAVRTTAERVAEQYANPGR